MNVLTGQIATLNTQISQLQGVNLDASSLVDQRDVLIGQLSNLVDVATIQSDNGLTLTTSNGTALVVGGQSFALSTQVDPSRSAACVGARHRYHGQSDLGGSGGACCR